MASVLNVPGRNLDFVGRAQALEELRHGFAVRGSLGRVRVVSGAAGAGKTALAVEFAHRHAGEYGIVWFMRAHDPATLAQDFSDLAQRLGIAGAQDASFEATHAQLRKTLEQRSDWLLIFDEAQRPEDVYGLLPDNPGGDVLVTTRSDDWAGLGRITALAALRRAEAVELIQRRSGRDEPAEEIEPLAKALGDWPLALEQAGADIRQRGIACADYLRRFEALWAEFLRSPRQASSHPDAVAMVWELSFRDLEAESPVAADTLTLISFFATQEVPYLLLRGGAARVPQPLGGMLLDVEKFRAAIAAMQRYSLVNAGDTTLTMPRRTATLCRERLGEDKRKEWARIALVTAHEAFPFDVLDARTWRACADLLPHVLEAAGHAERFGVEAWRVAGAMDVAGQYLHEQAHYTRARDVYERALRLCELAYGDDHPLAARLANNLARTLTRLGDTRAAMLHFERTMKLDADRYGERNVRVASVANNYGIAMHNSGQIEGAMQQFQWALDVFENHYGPEHARVAAVLNNIGYVHRGSGELEHARAYLQRSLETGLKTLGARHPSVARIHANLGRVLQAKGELADAREHLEKAIAIDEAVLGHAHPDVAHDLMYLGDLDLAAGEPASAEQSYRRALEAAEGAYGDRHPAVVKYLLKLAAARKKIGDRQGAKQIQGRVASLVGVLNTGAGHTAARAEDEDAPIRVG